MQQQQMISTFQLRSCGATLQIGYAGLIDGFLIAIPETHPQGYSYVDGYLGNADFPEESSKRDRGEIFYIKTDASQEVGISLAFDALRLMQANGCVMVNIKAMSRLEIAVVRELEQLNAICLIRRALTGKSEYQITLPHEVIR